MTDNGDTRQDVLSLDEIRVQLDKLGSPEATIKGLASIASIMRDTLADAEADGWQIFTVADAYTPRLPREYIVSGLFKLPSLSIVYGAPGCLKTMLAVDLAACVAVGAGWLPPLPTKDDVSPHATLQNPVLWLDFDNGKDEMHDRVEAGARGHSLTAEDPFYYVSMPTPWLDGSDSYSIECLAQRIRALDARLVVIDNLKDVSGKADENSPEIGNVMSNFRRLADDTRSAVILIHHQRKATGQTGRAGDALRGHSAIEAALDLALHIEREAHAETVKVRATKVRGPDVLPFGAMFTFAHKPGTEDLARVQFFGLPVEDLTSDAAIRRAVIEAVGDGPKINKGELKEKVKAALPDVGINRIGNAIDYLADQGKLVLTVGNRGAKVYDLPHQPSIDDL